MNLFQKTNIKLSSGIQSDFKIECDALTEKDWECLAYLISKKIKFGSVRGVPAGGEKLAKVLEKYSSKGNKYVLICDDVLTTGLSMEIERDKLSTGWVIGVVVFARNRCDNWVTPLFKL